MLLIIGAVLLVVAVVAALAVVLTIQLRRVPLNERLAELKDWQGLIGSVLGLLGAAGVLVLGSAIETEQARARAQAASHAIGTGMALEVEKLMLGLQVGRQIGQGIDMNGPDLASACVQYSTALKRVMSPSTPVYNSVLGSTADFGDVNLALFVRFYAFYEEFLRNLTDIDQRACDNAAADEIGFMMSQLNGGMGYYEIIARNYDIAPPLPLPPAETSPP